MYKIIKIVNKYAIINNEEETIVYTSETKDFTFNEIFRALNDGEITEEDIDLGFRPMSIYVRDNIINACENHDFVGIICDDGHEHTVKAFGEICGTPFTDFDNELDNQIQYCLEISKGFDVEILTAETEEEAVEKDIIEEGTYYVK